jgi:hypothetical protein
LFSKRLQPKREKRGPKYFALCNTGAQPFKNTLPALRKHLADDAPFGRRDKRPLG